MTPRRHSAEAVSELLSSLLQDGKKAAPTACRECQGPCPDLGQRSLCRPHLRRQEDRGLYSWRAEEVDCACGTQLPLERCAPVSLTGTRSQTPRLTGAFWPASAVCSLASPPRAGIAGCKEGPCAYRQACTLPPRHSCQGPCRLPLRSDPALRQGSRLRDRVPRTSGSHPNLGERGYNHGGAPPCTQQVHRGLRAENMERRGSGSECD